MDAATDGEGDGHHADYATGDVQPDWVVLDRRRDVQHRKLVGAGGAAGAGALRGVARIVQVDEANALHDAAVLPIKARHDSDGLRIHCGDE